MYGEGLQHRWWQRSYAFPFSIRLSHPVPRSRLPRKLPVFKIVEPPFVSCSVFSASQDRRGPRSCRRPFRRERRSAHGAPGGKADIRHPQVRARNRQILGTGHTPKIITYTHSRENEAAHTCVRARLHPRPGILKGCRRGRRP